MRGIYRFHVDCGRSGELFGLFVADSAEVEKAIGRRIYFSDVLGKHSEIDGELEAEEVALISDEPDDVATFDRLKLTTGYNPLDYLSEG